MIIRMLTSLLAALWTADAIRPPEPTIGPPARTADPGPGCVFGDYDGDDDVDLRDFAGFENAFSAGEGV